MITEDYVDFEMAELLKQKGFNESCLCNYAGDEGVAEEWYDDYRERVIRVDWEKGYLCEPIDGHAFRGDTIAAPTHQMVLKWLREIHYLHVEISIGSDSSTDVDGNTTEKWYYWTYSIRHTIDGHMIYSNNCLLGTEYQSYEDTVEASIKYCLTNLI